MVSSFSSNEISNQKSTSNNEDIAVTELRQGKMLLNTRKNYVDKLRKNILLLEPFDTTRLNEVDQNELKMLNSLETGFQQKLSEYSTRYKSFMENYYRAVEDVKKCKANCLTNKSDNVGSGEFSKEACQMGCTLKGPNISS